MTHDYNTFPPGWREITEKQFARSSYFQEVPALRETRQMFEEGTKDPAKLMLDRDRPVYFGSVLYHYHDQTGVALASDYWEGKVRYFKFGCDHAYRPLSSDEEHARGLRFEALICTKCELVVGRRDSSG